MKTNFKIVKISVSDGSYSLMAERLDEITAWKYADRMERKQVEQGSRSAWYAVTNAGDWQSMAASFYKMRKANGAVL